jgi:hypothetical protein
VTCLQMLEALADEYESWAIGVISKASDLEQAKAVLMADISQPKSGILSQYLQKAVLIIAMDTSAKAFTSSNWVQLHVDELWYGKIHIQQVLQGPVFGVDLTILLHSARVLLGAAVPILEIMHRRKERKERRLERRWGDDGFEVCSAQDPKWGDGNGFYGIPQVKFIIRTTLHACFVCVCLFGTSVYYATPPSTTAIPPIGHWDFVFWIWVMALVGDELNQVNLAATLRVYLASVHNQIDSLYMTGLVIVGVLRLLSLFACTANTMDPDGETEQCQLFSATRVFLGLFSIPAAGRMLTFLRVSDRLGDLPTMLGMMMQDVLAFLLIFLCVALGFCLTFIGLAPINMRVYDTEEPEDQVNFDYWSRTLAVPFWAVFQEFERAYDLFEHQQVPHIGFVVLWFCSLASSVILVNMLIAMMTSTCAYRV